MKLLYRRSISFFALGLGLCLVLSDLAYTRQLTETQRRLYEIENTVYEHSQFHLEQQLLNLSESDTLSAEELEIINRAARDDARNFRDRVVYSLQAKRFTEAEYNQKLRAILADLVDESLKSIIELNESIAEDCVIEDRSLEIREYSKAFSRKRYFDKLGSCSSKKVNYLETKLKKVPDVYKRLGKSAVIKSIENFPVKCVQMAGALFRPGAWKKSRYRKNSKYVTCVQENGRPKEGNVAPCWNDLNIAVAYNSYIDAANCVGVDPKEFFPIILRESQFQANLVSGTGASGYCHLTEDGIVDVLALNAKQVKQRHNARRAKKYWKPRAGKNFYDEKKLIKSFADQAKKEGAKASLRAQSCSRMLTYMDAPIDFIRSKRCSVIDHPKNSIRGSLYCMLYYKKRTNGIRQSKCWFRDYISERKAVKKLQKKHSKKKAQQLYDSKQTWHNYSSKTCNASLSILFKKAIGNQEWTDQEFNNLLKQMAQLTHNMGSGNVRAYLAAYLSWVKNELKQNVRPEHFSMKSMARNGKFYYQGAPSKYQKIIKGKAVNIEKAEFLKIKLSNSKKKRKQRTKIQALLTFEPNGFFDFIQTAHYRLGPARVREISEYLPIAIVKSKSLEKKSNLEGKCILPDMYR